MFEDLKKIPELSSVLDKNNIYEASFNKENILKLFQELKNSELFYQELFMYAVIFGLFITLLKPKIIEFIKN